MPGIVLEDGFFQTSATEGTLQESIARILLTSPGERVGNPTFGCRLKDFLFDLETYLMEDIQLEIIRALSKWEPRVVVQNITITKGEDLNRFFVNIQLLSKVDYTRFTYETAIGY
jgi:phage baseplate assembly protein W